jgi:hypothetical protein
MAQKGCSVNDNDASSQTLLYLLIGTEDGSNKDSGTYAWVGIEVRTFAVGSS